MGGSPYLLSFEGMDRVLGKPSRKPLVAPVERPFILQSWAPWCGGRVPCQRYIPFGQIRTMSPEEFVRLLAHDLRARGVIAGSNYRFGYKAAGDTAALRELGAKHGARCSSACS